jgi:hypothetical protein
VDVPLVTASVSDTPGCAFDPVRFREPLAFPSPAVGVGQNEESLPPVGGADVGRADRCPFRIEPDFGKVS